MHISCSIQHKSIHISNVEDSLCAFSFIVSKNIDTALLINICFKHVTLGDHGHCNAQGIVIFIFKVSFDFLKYLKHYLLYSTYIVTFLKTQIYYDTRG